MREVTAETAADYLRERGRVPAGRRVSVRELGGGVSNVVMRVDVEGEAPSSSSRRESGCGPAPTG